jgi:hypothetical protein
VAAIADASVFNCLPLTVGLAKKYRRRLREMLADQNPSWPFEDRILVWLEPVWADEVRAFHASPDTESGLQWMYSDAQLVQFDQRCLPLLRSKLGIIQRTRQKPVALWFAKK